MSRPTHEPERPDLRLVPAAVAAWAAALAAAPLARWSTLFAIAAVMISFASAVWLVRGRSRRVALAAVLACAGAVMAGGLLRSLATGGSVLAALAEQRAVAQVSLVVTGDPRPIASSSGSFGARVEQVLVSARLEHIEARGASWRTRLPVTVIAPAGPWGGLLPSQRLEASVRLAPPRTGGADAALVVARGPPLEVTAPSAAQGVAGRLRAGLRASVARLPANERGLLPGLVVGDTSAMPPALNDQFRTAGLTHLVAVSGANVAIILAAVLLAARWAGLRARALHALGLAAIFGFLILARPDPSVLRATVCGVVAVIAMSRGGRGAGLPALNAAVIVLLFVDPGLGRSYGFALSVLATGGLLVVAPGWRTALGRFLPQLVADAVAIPAAAQVVCAPVIAMLAGNVSLVAVPANLLVAPAVAPATVLGVLAALVAPVSTTLGQIPAAIAWIPTAWIVCVARVAAEVPSATVPWPDGVMGALILAGLVIGGWVVGPILLRRRWAMSAGVLLLALLGLLASPLGPRSPWPPQGTRAVFCDVGQGDAAVLLTGPRHAVLVDAGPDPRLVDDCLDDLGVRVLDAVVLSHFHADHVDGLPGALDGRAVGEIVVAPIDDPLDRAQAVYGWAAAAKVPVRRGVVGERRAVGPLTWEVVWPKRVIKDGSIPNNASLVLVVDLDGVRLLMTGDVEVAAQGPLLALLSELRPTLDVLKVPHHGSRSQDPRLPSVAHPRAAVVSVGDGNTYGHPAEETLMSYTELGIPLLRTDLDGAVAVVGAGLTLHLVPRRS